MELIPVNHLKVRNKIKKYVCTFCETSYGNKRHLFLHIKINHEESFTFKKFRTMKSFLDSDYLENHTGKWTYCLKN